MHTGAEKACLVNHLVKCEVMVLSQQGADLACILESMPWVTGSWSVLGGSLDVTLSEVLEPLPDLCF